MSKYISDKEMGNIRISEDVIMSIVAMAASEVDGVVPTGVKTAAVDWKDLISKKGLTKNVRVEMSEDDKVNIDMDISVNYGIPVATIAENVQSAVREAVVNYTGLEVGFVNVHVTGISFPKQKEN